MTDTPWGTISLDEPPAGTAARILDAALARFVAQGIAGTTLGQIAEDAGISRVWLYRFYDNRDDIIRALLGRETKRFLTELADDLDLSAAPTDTVIRAADRCIAHLRANALLQRVLRTEPEVAGPFIGTGSAPVRQAGVDVASRYLRTAAGMPPARAKAVAEALLRLLVSIVITEGTGTDFDDPRRRRAFLDHVIPGLVPRD